MTISGIEIIRQLVREKWTASFVLPNYTPPKWFECDVFEVTKAGYFHEYEVKVSRADFKADATKERMGWQVVGRSLARVSVTKKHDLLAERSTLGPSRFTFVVPEGLVGLHEVPEWAGLMVARRARYGLTLVPAKKAPRLHEQTFDLRQTERTCYYRFHRAVAKYEDTYQADGSGI
jgi:hypothetical protein